MTRVIIVDDEVDLATVLSDYLVIKGIDVVGTGVNGRDAVDLCIKHRPDFVILDLSMPDFDGFYALEEIYKIDSAAKIIVITGLLDEFTQNTLDKYKIFASFIKPTNPIDIVNCINNANVK